MAAVLLVAGANFLGLYYPPPISSQGVAHRIFYLHVPIAWVALYAPFVGSVCGALYLFTRKPLYDMLSCTATRLSLIFSVAVIYSGAIWAHVEWGTYWNVYDSRLNSFLILLLVLIGYFLLRNMIESEERKATVSSLLAIFSALASLMTWFAIRLVEPDTHPTSVLGSMAAEIKLTFWLSVLAYHFFFLAFFYRSFIHEKLARATVEGYEI
jgi:heme exporter protein C